MRAVEESRDVIAETIRDAIYRHGEHDPYSIADDVLAALGREYALPTKTVQRGRAGFVTRLLVVPVYEGESDGQALTAALEEADR